MHGSCLLARSLARLRIWARSKDPPGPALADCSR